MKIAGIDVHKKVLMVVVIDASTPEGKPARRRFATMPSDLHRTVELATLFRRLLPRLGYKSAIWAVAHRLCRLVWKILHEGVRFIEQGREPDPQAKKKRALMLARALLKLGYEATITPINQVAATNAMQI